MLLKRGTGKPSCSPVVALSMCLDFCEGFLILVRVSGKNGLGFINLFFHLFEINPFSTGKGSILVSTCHFKNEIFHVYIDLSPFQKALFPAFPLSLLFPIINYALFFLLLRPCWYVLSGGGDLGPLITLFRNLGITMFHMNPSLMQKRRWRRYCFPFLI